MGIIFLVKLTVSQLVKEFPYIIETEILFSYSQMPFLSQTSPIHTQTYFSKNHFNIIFAPVYTLLFNFSYSACIHNSIFFFAARHECTSEFFHMNRLNHWNGRKLITIAEAHCLNTDLRLKSEEPPLPRSLFKLEIFH
jgi:hypothetical protein